MNTIKGTSTGMSESFDVLTSKMAQAQLDLRSKQNNTFYFDIEGELTVKVWRKGREGYYVTMMKSGTCQSLTIPMHVFRGVLEAQDVLLLAGDFIAGRIGVSPNDLNYDA